MNDQTVVAEPFDAAVEQDPDEDLVEADDLIEEVSIDGLCGVY